MPYICARLENAVDFLDATASTYSRVRFDLAFHLKGESDEYELCRRP